MFDYRSIIDSISEFQSPFHHCSTSSEDICVSYVNSVMVNDEGGIAEMLTAAFGVAGAETLYVEGGYRLDGNKLRRRPTGYGIKAASPLEAVSILVHAYLAATSGEYDYNVRRSFGGFGPLFNRHGDLLSDNIVIKLEAGGAPKRIYSPVESIARLYAFVAGLKAKSYKGGVVKDAFDFHENKDEGVIDYGLSKDDLATINYVCSLANKDSGNYVLPYPRELVLAVHEDVPANVYFGRPNSYVSREYMQLEVWFLATLLAHVCKEFRVVEKEDGFKFYMEDVVYHVDDDGITDAVDRRLQNVLLVHPRLEDGLAAVNCLDEDVSFINGFGSFILSILHGLNDLNEVRVGSTYPVGRWARDLAKSTTVDTEEESGAAPTGARGDYNLHAAQPFVWSGIPALVVTRKGLRLGDHKKGFSKFNGNRANYAEAALDRFNMIVVHKGSQRTLMPSSYVALRGSHLGDLGTQLIERLFDHIGADKVRVALFPGMDQELTKDTMVSYFEANGYIALSTKVSKITKRITLGMPSAAWVLGGRKEAFVMDGARAPRAEVHEYRSAVFPQLVNAPGTAWLVGHMKEFMVKATLKRQFESAEPKHISYAIDGVRHNWGLNVETQSTTPQGNTVDGLFVTEGTVLATVPLHCKDGTVVNQEIIAREDGYISHIKLSKAQFGPSAILKVAIHYVRVESNAKLRSTFKSTVSGSSSNLWSSDRHHPEVIYNSLNVNVPEIDMIFTGDSDKAKDLLQSYLAIAAQTAIANNDVELIHQLNNLIGRSEQDCLVYHELLAALGEYDGFMQQFIDKYGRAVWFYNRDSVDAQLRAVRELYTNRANAASDKWLGRSVEWLHANCPETKDVDLGDDPVIVTSNINGDGTLTQYDEIFVFGQTEFTTPDGLHLPEFCYQRTFGFIGNEQHGDVVAGLKVELCSIDASVSVTNLMAAVARCVEVGVGNVAGDPGLAVKLVAEYSIQAQNQWLAVQAMANWKPIINKEGESLPVLEVLNSKGLTSEFVHLFSEETKEGLISQTISIEDLAAKLDDVVLSFYGQYVYLPAIAAQSYDTDDRESLAGRVYHIIRLLVAGVAPAALTTTIKAMAADIKVLATSVNGEKRIFMGRPSMSAKAMGVYGIPLDTVVISKGGKAHQALVKASVKAGLGSKVDGRKVLITRSPLPFVAALAVKVVEPGSRLASLGNGSQPTVNPLVCQVSAGDFDGDNYNFTPLEENCDYPLLTYDQVMSVITSRTGKNPVGADMDAYIADHYSPKVWKVSQLENAKLVSVKNLGWFEGQWQDGQLRHDSYSVATDTANPNGNFGLVSCNGGSIETQQVLVPATHRLAVVGESAAAAYQAMVRVGGETAAKVQKDLSDKFVNSDLSLPIYELYEGGTLGGLSWSAYSAICAIKQIIAGVQHGFVPNLTKAEDQAVKESVLLNNGVVESLIDASINADYTKRYCEVAMEIRDLDEAFSAGAKWDLVKDDEGLLAKIGFIRIYVDNYHVSELPSLIGFICHKAASGKFNPAFHRNGKPNGHAIAALLVYMMDQDLMAKLSSNSCVFNILRGYIYNCLEAKCPGLLSIVGIDAPYAWLA